MIVFCRILTNGVREGYTGISLIEAGGSRCRSGIP